MAQTSIWWTTGAGDGSAPYTQAQVTAWLARTFVNTPTQQGIVPDYPKTGGKELTCTVSGTTVNVAPGAGIVAGIPYESTTTEPMAIPTPLIGTTGHRIVLRADYAARTVRLALLSSSDGTAAIPALVQTQNTLWDIPIATLTITTGGVIALADARVWIVHNTDHVQRGGDTMRGALTVPRILASSSSPHISTSIDTAPANNRYWRIIPSSAGRLFFQVLDDAVTTSAIWLNVLREANTVPEINFVPGGDTLRSGGNPVLHTGNMALRVVEAWLANAAVTAAKLASDAVETAKISNLAVTTAKLADLAVTAAKLASNAVETAKIANAAVTTAKLADLAVTAGKLADSAVVAAKIAANAVSLDKLAHPPQRRGGNATQWATAGSTTYTPVNVRPQFGVAEVTIPVGQGNAIASVSFPTAFSGTPVVIFNGFSSFSPITVNASSLTATSFNLSVTRSVTTTEITVQLHWLALGPA